MNAFEASEVVARSLEHGEPYMEFARGRTASVGLYTLAPGALDPQGVHDEDEVYHVLQGRALLRVADADYPVGPGSIVYIEAGVAHGFHAIAEDLRVLVFFSETGAVLSGRAEAGRAAREQEHRPAGERADGRGATVIEIGRARR